MKKNFKLIVLILFMCLIFVTSNFLIIFIGEEEPFIILKNEVEIESITLISKGDTIAQVIITPTKEEQYCSLDNEMFFEMKNNTCNVPVTLVGSSIIYFKDDRGVTSLPLEVNNYVIDNSIDDNYYLALGDVLDLSKSIAFIGNNDITYNYDATIINVSDNLINTLSTGKTILEVKYQEQVIKTSFLVVSDNIVVPHIDTKKKQLGCNVYDEENANLLDEILASRVDKAGRSTRAGVVAAARFLTLEFPYRIPYFYENGRLHESNPHRADGEGRYYHIGLYLHKNKFSSIVKKVAGPATWGCGLINYEPNPPNYIPLTKMPNGLDCSGFVSWTILNGGFDIGDLGAGPTNYNYELPDTGEFTKLTNEVIASNIIKPGDLMSMSGHIAIVIGIDENNIYVAESLPRFRGVVANTYSKTKINKTFSHVVLMDRVYQNDGNLTYMW